MPNAKKLKQWFYQEVEEVENIALHAIGGRARIKVIVLLACVLGLDSADKATIGAIAGQLVAALDISYIQIGLLVTASTGIGALATLPMGILADRVNRKRLLSISIIFWGVAMAISGASNSFMMLLLTRFGLGAVVATAAPTIASLTGDYFRPGERGRIWGYILTGELVGVGFGLLVAGQAAAISSWRASFWVLAAITPILAVAIWQWLPEPLRGGQSYLSRTKEKIPSTKELQENGAEAENSGNSKKQVEAIDEVAEKVEESTIEPNESKILKKDPTNMSFWHAARYVLSIRTNILLIIASACGYFFFAGVRTFAVIFLRARFDLSQSAGKFIVVAIGAGAIIGVLISGRFSDKLIERGHISARITVGGVAFLLTAILFFIGLFMNTIYVAVVIFFIASAALGGTNPPLDAARLDIMHSRLWGRAESIRTTFRYSFEAVAPLSFGMVASALGATGSTFGVSSEGIKNALPLAHTFMFMLAPVLVAAIILLALYWGYNPYPHDIATALASEEATRDEG